MSADSRKSFRGGSPLRFVLPVLLVLVGLGGLLMYLERSGAGDRHDPDLCPLDTASLAGSATLLLDFRKPLDTFGLSLPGTTLRDLSLDLDGATELRAFVLTGDVDAPRQFIGRLCKPYDNTDLAVGTAKDQRGAVRDCDDLPAQVPTRVRELADGFCERRAALQDRIYAMARRPVEGAVVNAHLLAALDDTVLEFADRQPPHALYVFSDMMQHSDWYSHLDLDWTEWGFEEFVARREATYPTLEYGPAMAGQRVQIYYVPRRGRTGQPRTEGAHKQFWREYFAGAQVTFRDQPAMSSYAGLSLMGIPTEAEVAAQERDEAERLLALVEEEQAMLAEAREKAREEQEQARRAMEEELRRRERELEAEVERMRADAEARAALEEAAATAAADTADEQPDDDGQVVSAPETVDEEVAVEVSGAEDPAPPELSPCEVDLVPGTTRRAAYPRGGRFNLGDAVMLVRFTVDEEGVTPDDEVFVDPEGSSASRARNFGMFAETAKQTVRRWEFEFDDVDDENCIKRQQLSIAFEFQYD